MNQRVIPLRDLEEERKLFGSLDRNLQLLRRTFKVEALSRGGALRLSGSPDSVDEAARALDRALERIRSGRAVTDAELESLFGRGSVEEAGAAHFGAGSEAATPRIAVEPRSENQARYLEAIRKSVITFGIGPAGTGKSWLAVASAVQFLRAGQFRRIVLCRPAVEAGESLGFLPGDLAAKINPYLRPLYDALNDVMPKGQLKRYMEEEIVEILPLAYMRGRTLDNSLIILDEAQNCTNMQMKMALTRLGARSKMIVTGDVTQIDLPGHKASGLLTARRILHGIAGVEFVHMTRADVVRHPVVAEIVRAYSRDEEQHPETPGTGGHAAPSSHGHPHGAPHGTGHGPAHAHGTGHGPAPRHGDGRHESHAHETHQRRDHGDVRPRYRGH
jgi:phosphate starvation-inducible PhoH-like protein